MSRSNTPSASPASSDSDSALRRGATVSQSSSARCRVAAMPVARTAFERSRETTTRVPSRPPSLSEPSFIATSEYVLTLVAIVTMSHATRSTDVVALEPRRAVRQDQRVAIPEVGLWLDRRGLVDHPRIVQQQQRPGLGEGEALSIRAVGLEHPRLTALHALAGDQQHRHEIHAIAVRAFRGRAPEAVGGVD